MKRENNLELKSIEEINKTNYLFIDCEVLLK